MITTFARSLPYAQDRTHQVMPAGLSMRHRRGSLAWPRLTTGDASSFSAGTPQALPRRGRPSFHLRIVAGRQTPTLPMRRSGLGICSRAT